MPCSPESRSPVAVRVETDAEPRIGDRSPPCPEQRHAHLRQWSRAFCPKPLHLELFVFSLNPYLLASVERPRPLQAALVEAAYRPGKRLRKGCTWRSLI